MQKLHIQEKEGGPTVLGALELPTDRLQASRSAQQDSYFSYYFSYFSHGEISTVGPTGSRFEFHRWARKWDLTSL